MALSALLPLATALAPTIISSVQGGASGGQADAQGRRWCPGRPSDQEIDLVRQQATSSELAPIIRHWDGSRGREIGGFHQVSASEIGYWLMGNRDCRHSDPNGITVQNTFLGLVRKYTGNFTAPITQGQPTSPWQQAGQAVLSGVTNVATGVVGGAASGAAAAAQSAGAAAQTSSQLTQLLPILGVLGLAAFILLRK